jgi:hypothetical protein
VTPRAFHRACLFVAPGLFVLAASCGPTNYVGPGRTHSSSYGYAAANVAVGAALYAVGGGCKIAGCPTNTKCNVVTERCDPLKCLPNTCGAAEQCDEASGRCLPAGLGVVATPASASVKPPPVPVPPAGPNAQP